LSKRHEKKFLREITSGHVWGCGSLRSSYLCEAGTGQYRDYSAPAGWGTPNGINAF
jgi:hypothetical protein